MKKFPHKLKRNKRNTIPHHIIFYDTESRQHKEGSLVRHTLRLGWACYVSVKSLGSSIETNEEWLSFKDKKDFWKWVERHLIKKRKLYLVAHNQHFDFTILDGINELKRMGFTLQRWTVDSNVFLMIFTKKNHMIVILDSLNIFKTSIQKLGEMLGLPKLKVNLEHVSDKKLSTYCKRDTEILKEAFLKWLKFIKLHDLGNFKYTLPSQAFTAFKHRFMDYDIFIHARKRATKLERDSYRGGRTECFYIGHVPEKIYYLDVNSLYPYVMKNYEYPIKLIKHGYKLSPKGLKRFLSQFCVIARVKIDTPENVFGYKSERLIFPIGTFDITLCTQELKYALDHGYLKEIYEYAVYEKAPIFVSYVEFFSSLKEQYSMEGNTVMRSLAKLMLNSLYGKFGQRNEVWKPIGESVCEMPTISKYINVETGETGILYEFGGKQYLKTRGEEEAVDSFVAIASEVTANARMYLWKLMKKAGLSNLYYCDTDSLFVNEKGYKNLKSEIHDYKLGKLKLEGVSDGVQINNVKDYVFNGKVKLKGVKKNSVKISENQYKTQRFYKFRTLIRKGILDTPISEEYIKTIKREYKKGIVTPSGRVLPFQFPL